MYTIWMPLVSTLVSHVKYSSLHPILSTKELLHRMKRSQSHIMFLFLQRASRKGNQEIFTVYYIECNVIFHDDRNY